MDKVKQLIPSLLLISYLINLIFFKSPTVADALILGALSAVYCIFSYFERTDFYKQTKADLDEVRLQLKTLTENTDKAIKARDGYIAEQMSQIKTDIGKVSMSVSRGNPSESIFKF